MSEFCACIGRIGNDLYCPCEMRRRGFPVTIKECQMIGELSGAPYFFENPVSVFSAIFGKPSYTFNPYDFTGYCSDDNYTKKTYLWAGGDL